MLLRKLLLASLILALVFAAGALFAIERVRASDRALALERVASSFNTDLVRARCEANPRWFLAGPRDNAPSAALMADPDADVLAPRPDTDPRPFEFFSYDVEFVGQSTAAPRFPQTMRALMRAGRDLVTEPFVTAEGTGVQTAIRTNWEGPCLVLLFRQHPPPRQFWQRATLYAGLTGGSFLVALLVIVPLDRRIRRLGGQLRASARTEYREPASVGGKDELSVLGFAFNEAGADINRLQTDVRDRDAETKRVLSHLSADTEALYQTAIAQTQTPGPVLTAVMQVLNSVAGAQMRDPAHRPPADFKVGAVVTAVAQELALPAASRRVLVDVRGLDADLSIVGDAGWLTQALRVLVAQAIDREPAGGTVTVSLDRPVAGRPVIRVRDHGSVLPDPELKKINAVRRFRGDEGRGGDLRGDIGLALAIVHEVAHRLELQAVFSRPVDGGLEVTLGPDDAVAATNKA